MNKTELHSKMTALYKSTMSDKEKIQRAVQLGIEYERELLEEGIKIVFNESKKG